MQIFSQFVLNSLCKIFKTGFAVFFGFLAYLPTIIMYVISTCGNQVDFHPYFFFHWNFIVLIINCQEEPDAGTCFIKDVDVVLA